VVYVLVLLSIVLWWKKNVRDRKKRYRSAERKAASEWCGSAIHVLCDVQHVTCPESLGWQSSVLYSTTDDSRGVKLIGRCV